MRLEIWIGGRWWQATDPRWYLGESPTGAWVGCQSRGDATRAASSPAAREIRPTES